MQISAGILPYRKTENGIEVYLVYPGGPQNKKRNLWGISKGGVESGEDLVQTAVREFKEETGFDVDISKLKYIGSVKQRSDKFVHAWAIELNNLGKPKENMIEIERFGRKMIIPEISDGRYFKLSEIENFTIFGQIPLIKKILEINP